MSKGPATLQSSHLPCHEFLRCQNAHACRFHSSIYDEEVDVFNVFNLVMPVVKLDWWNWIQL